MTGGDCSTPTAPSFPTELAEDASSYAVKKFAELLEVSWRTADRCKLRICAVVQLARTLPHHERLSKDSYFIAELLVTRCGV